MMVGTARNTKFQNKGEGLGKMLGFHRTLWALPHVDYIGWSALQENTERAAACLQVTQVKCHQHVSTSKETEKEGLKLHLVLSCSSRHSWTDMKNPYKSHRAISLLQNPWTRLLLNQLKFLLGMQCRLSILNTKVIKQWPNFEFT